MTVSWTLRLFGLSAALAAGLFVHNSITHLPIGSWPSPLLDPSQMSMEQIILSFNLFPRATVAILAGAALGLSGALLQQLLRNPIADPSTLGISAGAQLAVVIATLFFPVVLDGYRGVIALGGAATAAVLVFALGWRSAFEPVTMVVSGLLIGITASALSAALTLSQGEYLMSLVTWNGGSLSQQDWSTSRSLSLELLAGLVATALLVRPLVVLGVGDAAARSLGASLPLVRFCVAGVAVALAGVVTAAVGLVSFVGLAAPALVRAAGVRRPAAVIFTAPIAGGLLLWLCDGAVQMLATSGGETLPTGAMTALIGAPLLLWLLPRVRFAGPERGEPSRSVHRRSGTQLLGLMMLPIGFIALTFMVGRSVDGWTILSLQELQDLAPMRWPRMLAAGAAGGLLAVTGTILQRLTGNPMASPEVIGVSAGAGLGFAAVISLAPAAGSAETFLGASLGALLVMSVVLWFASQNRLPPERLLLAGVAMSSLSSAMLTALMAIGDQRAWQILAWLGGTGSTATPTSALFLAALAALMLAVSLTFVRWLAIMPLGLAIPQALGVPLRLSRVIMLTVCGIATGAASMLVGPLSFIGLIAPHITLRAGFVSASQQIVASFILGAAVTAFADFGARAATFPYELPLGLFSALAGAPYLIWLISRR